LDWHGELATEVKEVKKGNQMQKNLPVRYAAERLALRLLLTLLATVFVVVIVPELWRLLSPFVIALPIAASLQPSIRFFQEKLRIKRGIAVAFWVLLVCTAAFVLLYWFISFVVVQVMNAMDNMPSILGSVTDVLQAATGRILEAVQDLPSGIEQNIRSSLDSAFRTISDAGMSLASELVSGVVTFAASLPYAFIYANFLILGLFFFTGRIGKWQAMLKKRKESPDPASIGAGNGESMAVLRQSAVKGILGYIRVQFLFFMLTFLLSWVYFQTLEFDYAILIGVAAAFLELIPQFGCGTLYIPWAIASFIIGADRNGWLILGLYIVYCTIRRLTEPMLLGSNLGVSPLASLIGMFVGMQLAGVVGLIAGPIVMVILTSAVRAKLFDGALADCKMVSRHMRVRWRRGRK